MNMNAFSLFEQVLMEADEPPDLSMDTSSDSAPPADGGDPPDLGNDSGDNMPSMDDQDSSNEPPSLDDGGNDDFGMDDENNQDESDNDKDETVDLGLDDKVSNVLNMGLYQKFLSLLNTINSQSSTIKNNNDLIVLIAPNSSINIIDEYNKLDENIRIYLKNYFMDRNYSVNLLFFNKCMNLLKLLNDAFNKNLNKAIKSVK